MNTNPYEPPRDLVSDDDYPDGVRATFYLTQGELDNAEMRFLSLKHPMLTVIGCLSKVILVLLAGIVLIYLPSLLVPFLLGVAVAFFAPYLLVKASRQRLRATMADRGIAPDVTYEFISWPNKLVLRVDSTTWSWESARVRVLESLNIGLLIQLEPDLFFIVPKRGEFDTPDFRTMRRVLERRLTG